jgi:hypothetical protein
MEARYMAILERDRPEKWLKSGDVPNKLLFEE